MKTKIKGNNKNNKNGISLIVLVITIIVMIILAAAVILSLSGSGIIDRANEAVDKTNEAQVQTLANMIWAEAYLDEVTNVDAEYIKLKLIENGVDANKFDISVENNGVIVKLKNKNWETLYEKSDGQTENGIIKVSDSHIFNGFDRYRLTIAGENYTGTLETRLLYSDGMYFFATLRNNEATYYSSIADALLALPSVPTDAVIVLAENSTDDNGKEISNIVITTNDLQPSSKEYMVTKIERQEVEKKIVFEGDPKECNGVVVENIDITHDIMIVVDEEIIALVPGNYLVINDELVPGGITDWYLIKDGSMVGMMKLESTKKVYLGLSDFDTSEKVIIYDLGQKPDMVREGDYVAQYINNNWTLMWWPSDQNSAPQTVAGKHITAVVPNYNTFNYDRELEIMYLIDLDGIIGNIKVDPSVNYSKVFEGLHVVKDYPIVRLTIDLSELNDVTIPQEVLDMRQNMERLTIYVTEQVKANYLDEDSVKIKE